MFKLAAMNLLRHKSRTALSLLGIAIGVIAIIGMVSVVDGLLQDIQGAFSKMQGVMVMQEGANGPYFSKIDSSYEKKLEAIPWVESVVPEIMIFPKSIEGKSTSSSTGFSFGGTTVIGSDWSKQNDPKAASFSGEIVEGRGLTGADRKKAVIGLGIKDDYKKFLNSSIKIEDESFKVVGVYRTGSSFLDSSILIGIDDIRDISDFPKDKVSMYSISLTDSTRDKDAVKMINFRYGDELHAYVSSDITEQISGVIGDIRLYVFVVAAVSAIVAGVGIINTMLMSVLERYKEIGALKAVGWANADVMKMIIFESVLLGVFGGIIGIILSFGVASALESFLGLNTLVSLPLVIEVFAFALAIGLFAGVYPAYVASKMDPIDALVSE